MGQTHSQNNHSRHRQPANRWLCIAASAHPVSTPIPEEQQLAKRLFTPLENSAEITVKRDEIFGIPCTSRLFINAATVADIHKSEKAIIYLPPGNHILSVKMNMPCGMGNGIGETSVTLSVGEKRIFRITHGKHGEIGIQPTAF